MILIFSSQVGKSQENSMYFLRGVPQNNSINASAIPKGTGYIGFPLLSSLQLDYYNSGLTIKDLLHKGTGQRSDSLIIDYSGAAKALDANNVFFQELSNTLLGFGFKIKKSYISFALNSRVKTKIAYPGSIGDWKNGNYDYNSNSPLVLTTQGMALNMIAYNELALGYAQPIGDKFDVGVRLKYIMGMANIASDKFDITVNTLSSSELQLQTDIAIQTNFPISANTGSHGFVNIDSISTNSSPDIKQMFLNNRGFGFDLGVTYRPIPRLSLGIALNDIGFISWNSYPNRFVSNSTYKYTGVDLSNMLGGQSTNSSEYFKNMQDSIKNSFKIESNTASFQTGLQGNMIITANFIMLKWLDLGTMVKTQFYQGRPYPSLGFACGMSPSKLFSSTVTYSLRKGSYLNLGVGMAFNPGPFQIYIVTDNIPYLFAIESANALSMRMGINYLFGTGKKQKEAF